MVEIQSGRDAAKQLVAAHRGLNASSFAYKDRGMMATIGRRAAIAEIRGPAPLECFSLRDTLGWLVWLFLHLANLLGVRNRVAVLVNGVWRYVGWPAGSRVIVEDSSARDDVALIS
jgi:NADH dehydrogenase